MRHHECMEAAQQPEGHHDAISSAHRTSNQLAEADASISHPVF